ncbi:ubiquitin homeostasis protein lub1 [Pseudomassariella vexata]|uniref:Ubiquitin homeostasis protein lub1 n=1 Tax=Pseudomassariella vexata TaxID=1141098 RepID=A0A1Y2D943_9PEZI|nr:ubiquitin homeostasis protein lub1 [Pseudomassariella vexata]ORY55694.1 ubiquitin homeostasis protein lub1 [Pseudomassariella vexata]
MADFKLSAQLAGHNADVRDLVFPSDDLLFSASRDHTVRAWRRTSSSPPEFEFTILNQIHDYINALAYIPRSADYPEGLVVSGGKDPCLDVRKTTAVSGDNAERLLPGHANNVCALAVTPSGKYFVSGSWDHTARVWSSEKWDTDISLIGHEGAVWDVLPLSDAVVVTGCADKNIRIFDLRKQSAGQAEARSTIYTPDVVRGLCRVPAGHPAGAEIASSHNDGVIRLWKLTGQQVAELRGHESFVYRLAALPSGELVSAAEDRTVRVWRGTECVQTITHPAISVWTVVACPNGDIASGTSDGIVRIFSRAAERVASADVIQNFDEAVKSSSIPQQQLGDINKEKLPGPEFLTTKAGTKEGQVQMIREDNGSISAHTWSSAAQSWINVGTVVDSAASSGRKVEHNGKQWDFVFDVAIEEGQPSLKLPYNLSDNPYDTATKFINDNELSLNYLDQVAQFIVQNTQGASLGPSGTGGADPYGTESRYRPGEEQESSRTSALPQKECLRITAAKFDPMFKKIFTVNDALVAAGRKDISLNPSAKASLSSLRQAVESNSPMTPEHGDGISLVAMMCLNWDYKDRLAPLDLWRCCATSPLLARYTAANGPVSIAISSALNDSDGQLNENLVMMALRAIVNLFGSQQGWTVVTNQMEAVVTFLERTLGLDGSNNQAIGPYNRNLLIALTTVAINYSVLAIKKKAHLPEDAQIRLVKAIAHVLDNQTDSEVVFRALVAAGTFVVANPAVKDQVQGLEMALKKAKDRGTEVRVKEVADECLCAL